jgi:hypothetical protein
MALPGTVVLPEVGGVEGEATGFVDDSGTCEGEQQIGDLVRVGSGIGEPEMAVARASMAVGR